MPTALLVLAVGMHLAYQYDVWHLYWMPHDAGPGAFAAALAAVGHWYAFPSAVLVAVLVAGVAPGVTVAISLTRTALGEPRPERAPDVDAEPLRAA
jgi:hypothetical protein